MSSRIVIGTPRIPAKPPRRQPCTEPVPVGEYLKDPGFELWNTIHASDTIHTRTDLLFNPDPYPAWVQEDTVSHDEWQVVDTDPDTGTYHAEVIIPISGSSGVNARWMEPIRAVRCGTNGAPKGTNLFNAGRIPGGAFITWEVVAKVSSVSDGEPALSLPVDFFTEEGFGTGAGTSLVSLTDLTTSYAIYTASGSAPSDAVWMRPFIWPRHKVASSTTKTVRVDSCTLTVS